MTNTQTAQAAYEAATAPVIAGLRRENEILRKIADIALDIDASNSQAAAYFKDRDQPNASGLEFERALVKRNGHMDRLRMALTSDVVAMIAKEPSGQVWAMLLGPSVRMLDGDPMADRQPVDGYKLYDPKKDSTLYSQPAPATGKAAKIKELRGKYKLEGSRYDIEDDSPENFLAYVREHPGERAEEIARGLNLKKLPMVAIRNALGKKLRTTGKRRGTRYFARGGK